MKKPYQRPEVRVRGELRELTQGQGLRGDDDTFLFNWGPFHFEFSWGTNPS
jgi:hypothetical protein